MKIKERGIRELFYDVNKLSFIRFDGNRKTVGKDDCSSLYVYVVGRQVDTVYVREQIKKVINDQKIKYYSSGHNYFHIYYEDTIEELYDKYGHDMQENLDYMNHKVGGTLESISESEFGMIIADEIKIEILKIYNAVQHTLSTAKSDVI